MELSEHLVLVVDELIDAHDDTVRLAEERAPDGRWEAHICYLRQLRRVGREALAAAVADERAKPRRDRIRSSFPRRGDRRCADSGYGEGSA
jgi:hypothetical protein